MLRCRDIRPGQRAGGLNSGRPAQPACPAPAGRLTDPATQTRPGQPSSKIISNKADVHPAVVGALLNCETVGFVQVIRLVREMLSFRCFDAAVSDLAIGPVGWTPGAPPRRPARLRVAV